MAIIIIKYFFLNYRNDCGFCFCFFMIQSDRPIVSGLQHDYVIRLRVEPQQHLLVRVGRPNHIAGCVPEHMSDQDVGAVHRVHIGLRRHVQQSVARAPVAHEPEKKRY